MAQGGKGISRVLAKLKSSVEEGRYYEAHQMYRTLYFRCVMKNGECVEYFRSLAEDGNRCVRRGTWVVLTMLGPCGSCGRGRATVHLSSYHHVNEWLCEYCVVFARHERFMFISDQKSSWLVFMAIRSVHLRIYHYILCCNVVLQNEALLCSCQLVSATGPWHWAQKLM